VDSALNLGELAGNRFTITLRAVEADDEVVSAAIESVSKHGFVNYFGLQRFGTSAVPTHHIGHAILQSDFEKAIQLIIGPKEGDEEELADAKKVYAETGNAGEALWKLPKHGFNVERSLFQGLKSIETNEMAHSNDKFQALTHIPRTLRTMYIHAYQSVVWNRMVSQRLSEFDPLKAVEGDLVLPGRDSWDGKAKDAVMDIDPESMATDENEEKAAATKVSEGIPRPHVVTAEEAQSGKYSVDDVVMPLPGMDVIYPTNTIGALYLETLEADKVSEVISKGHQTREYSLAGAYRYMIARPHDLQFKLLRYTDPQEDLSYTDQDALNQVPLKTHEEGPLKALQIAFTLPSSTYATMLLREVMKTSTSASFHRNKEVANEAEASAVEEAPAAAEEVPAAEPVVN